MKEYADCTRPRLWKKKRVTCSALATTTDPIASLPSREPGQLQRGAGVQGARHVLHLKPYNWPFPDKPHDLSDLDEEDEERANPQPEQERRYPLSERQCPDYYFEEHDSLLTWNSMSDLIWVIENKRNNDGKARKDAWSIHYHLVVLFDFFLRVREGCNH